jgi:hypothetical protein
MRFQVLTAVNIKTAVSWVLASTSETSVNFYQATRRNKQEDSYVQSDSMFLQKAVIYLRRIYMMSVPKTSP